MGKYLFGTDGIRGRVNKYPMCPDLILKLGMAMAIELKETGVKGRNTVLVGKDTRISGDIFESILVSSLRSIGVDVILAGVIPTSAIALLTKVTNADLGVVLSASHNPYYDNGLKIFDSFGLKISRDVEKSIEKKILRNWDNFLVHSKDLGKVYHLNDSSRRYIDFVKITLGECNTLFNIKIVMDCANGSASYLGKNIFEELGAETIIINNNPDGFNINENCGSSYPEHIIKVVKEERANLGIALDGDADRVIVIDEKGEVADGDQIIAAITKYWYKMNKMPSPAIVTTIMSSLSLKNYLENLGVKLHVSSVGDRNVMQMMRKYNCNIGAEKSGHIILSDYISTGDGLIAALQILSIMVKEKKLASEVLREFIPTPQVNCNLSYSFDINSQCIKDVIQEAESKLSRDYRIVIRESGTEDIIRIMVEGEDIALINEVITALTLNLKKSCKLL